MSVESLANAIKNAVQTRIEKESRARHGIIRNGQFVCGADCYPFKSAVDVDTSNEKKVWAQLSPNGEAVIIGS